jgi:hypothetical protein
MTQQPRFYRLSLILTLAAPLAACGGSIRVVAQGPARGELALLGDRQEARSQAKTYMGQHCPQGYQVLDVSKAVIAEPSVKIGTSEGRLGVAGASPDSMPWRLRYQCENQRKPMPPLVDPERAQAVAPGATSTLERFPGWLRLPSRHPKLALRAQTVGPPPSGRLQQPGNRPHR